MVKPLDTPVPAEVVRLPRFAGFLDLRDPKSVAALFAALMAFQALGYLILGTGRPGTGFSASILVLHNLLALTCIWSACRRAQGAAALFWMLFLVTLLILLIPAAILAFVLLFNRAVVSAAIWRVLYCLYGAPILTMLFLPAADRGGRLKSEVFLDLFQVAVVVTLAFSTFFYLPVQQMLPADALLRDLSVSNLESLFLLVAVLVRLQVARSPATHSLFLRLGLFLLVCAVVTFIGNWIDGHGYTTASAWWDLGWALPYFVAGLVASSWTPEYSSLPASEPVRFLSFLGKNLVLVAILFSINLMMDQWKEAHGAALTSIAVGATLLAFTVRLALTQFDQQQEIAQRKAAQEELLVATETISGLLEDARIEANSIAQINLLGSLLQAAANRDEAFRTIPERLARLLPGTSGVLSVLNASRSYAESVAEWGSQPSQRLAPFDDARSDGAGVSIPLVANGEAIGVLVIHDDESAADSPASHDNDRARRQQLGAAVAEQIALTISNLDLRDALRGQATRDPLTGLYNRRYMQEFLEREIHRARRRERPLAVMILDIDHFKHYNDTYGHPAGDEALRFVAETLLGSVRAEDLACRYGGEEFVVLLPECSLQQAAVRAEEIRNRLKQLYEERAGELPQVITASIGVAAFPEITDQVDLLLKCADEALYQAKRAGRDRVAIAQPAQAASAGHP